MPKVTAGTLFLPDFMKGQTQQTLWPVPCSCHPHRVKPPMLREGNGLWAGPPGYLSTSAQRAKISTKGTLSSSFLLADSLSTFNAFTRYMK